MAFWLNFVSDIPPQEKLRAGNVLSEYVIATLMRNSKFDRLGLDILKKLLSAKEIAWM